MKITNNFHSSLKLLGKETQKEELDKVCEEIIEDLKKHETGCFYQFMLTQFTFVIPRVMVNILHKLYAQGETEIIENFTDIIDTNSMFYGEISKLYKIESQKDKYASNFICKIINKTAFNLLSNKNLIKGNLLPYDYDSIENIKQKILFENDCYTITHPLEQLTLKEEVVINSENPQKTIDFIKDIITLVRPNDPQEETLEDFEKIFFKENEKFEQDSKNVEKVENALKENKVEDNNQMEEKSKKRGKIFALKAKKLKAIKDLIEKKVKTIYEKNGNVNIEEFLEEYIEDDDIRLEKIVPVFKHFILEALTVENNDELKKNSEIITNFFDTLIESGEDDVFSIFTDAIQNFFIDCTLLIKPKTKAFFKKAMLKSRHKNMTINYLIERLKFQVLEEEIKNEDEGVTKTKEKLLEIPQKVVMNIKNSPTTVGLMSFINKRNAENNMNVLIDEDDIVYHMNALAQNFENKKYVDKYEFAKTAQPANYASQITKALKYNSINTDLVKDMQLPDFYLIIDIFLTDCFYGNSVVRGIRINTNEEETIKSRTNAFFKYMYALFKNIEDDENLIESELHVFITLWVQGNYGKLINNYKSNLEIIYNEIIENPVYDYFDEQALKRMLVLYCVIYSVLCFKNN